MEITNDFELALPPEEAYALLLDLERVVPCMPGAELGEPRGDGSRDVTVNVRVGPIKLSYQGSVTITERDDTLRRAVLRGEARELRGQGTASADIATVADVQLTGRAAQTARGMVKDVAARMIDDMAGCLDSRFSRVTSDGEDAAAPPAAPAQQPIRGGGLLLSVLAGRLRRLFSRSG
jgi:carbon monoxide dehydrogenase subunit G